MPKESGADDRLSTASDGGPSLGENFITRRSPMAQGRSARRHSDGSRPQRSQRRVEKLYNSEILREDKWGVPW